MLSNKILVKFTVPAQDSILSSLVEEAETTFTGDGGSQVAHLEKVSAASLIADLREFGYGCSDARWKKQNTRSGKPASVVTLTFTRGAMSQHDATCVELQDRTYHHVYVWENPDNVTINYVAPAKGLATIPVRMDGNGTFSQ